MTPKSILIVCTGNLCRSPMAEVLLQAHLAADPLRAHWHAGSAGVWATDDRPASPHAVAVMAERGLDLTHHRARLVTPGLMHTSHLILGMTPSHVEALRMAFPGAAGKVRLFAEMAGRSHGVEDPYGQPVEVYRSVAEEIEQIIQSGYSYIAACAEGSLTL
ncbi:MAG: low molecular weight protein arginine phosphatase [Anaerolineae bacterium]|nr:low molecular weight protein arginine phosphatase [Anaerolineae bacterium]